MDLYKNIICMIVIFCISKQVSCQNYEADVYDDYSSEGEAKADSSENSGFVTPLDFSPLFGGPAFGLSSVASAPVKQYQPIFGDAGGESLSGLDFFDGQSADKQFAPESFGFVPQFSQGLLAASAPVPEKYQEKTFQLQRTRVTASSADSTRAPLQFNIETNHAAPYKVANKPELNAALKSIVKLNSAAKFQAEDHLAPYKKYSFQQTNVAAAPAYHPSSDSFAGVEAFSLGGIDSHHSRFKRYTNKRKSQNLRNPRQNKKGSDEDSDDYDFYSSVPKEYRHIYDTPYYNSYGERTNGKDDYDYGGGEEYGSDEYERIKNLSEKQAAELKQNPDHCKQVKKDSMTCTVCKNPKTGGNYESCAYASEPKNEKYAYVKQQKFDSNDQPIAEDDGKEDSKIEKPVKSEKIKVNSPKLPNKKPTEKSYETHSNYKYPTAKSYTTSKPVNNVKSQKYYKSPKPVEKASSDYRDYYTAPTSVSTDSAKPARYEAYTQDDDTNYDDEEEDEEEEQPAQNNSQSNEEDDGDAPIPDFFTDNEEKKDVESVLAEFKNKDRTACKKIFKNHMTCYQCTDKRGMKHEECMFVSESAPKSSHLAYKEVKEFDTKPQATQTAENSQQAESKVVTAKPLPELILSTTAATTTTVDAFSKILKSQPIKKYSGLDDFNKITPTTFFSTTPFDKITTQLFQISSTAPSKLEALPTKAIIKREAAKPGNDDKKQNQFAKYETPPSDLSEFDRIADPEQFAAESKGAFWAETRPAYDKKLGVALPRYMLEKSEDETNFEKTVANYRE